MDYPENAMDPLISEELLEEFKDIYEKEFDEKLSDDEALEKALDVLQVFRAVYRPIPRGKRPLYSKIRSWYKDDE